MNRKGICTRDSYRACGGGRLCAEEKINSVFLQKILKKSKECDIITCCMIE